MVWVKEGKIIDTWPQCVTMARRIPNAPIYRITFSSSPDCLEVLKQLEDVLLVEETDSILIPDRLAGALNGVDHTCNPGLKNSALLSDLGQGKKVTVAVIDSGISISLYGTNLIKNGGEIPGDGIDNDLNGYVDDLYGWDFGDMDNDPSDLLGHGSEVASILLSVAPEVSILPIKVNSGMDMSFNTGNASEAIYYAVSRGADIINLSFSADNFSFAIYSAIIYAVNSGRIVIAAAGNDGSDVGFPASMEEVIAVGSYDALGMPSWFSPKGNTLDILGPGENVCAIDVNGVFTNVSGTSFSAPVISGTAAVLFSMNSNLTPESIKKILFKGIIDILDPGWDTDSGYGNISSDVLVAAATPSINLPDNLLKGNQLNVEITLPPTDTQTDILFALIFDDTVWWLDSFGFWHKADDSPFSPFMMLKPDTYITKGLYGPSGLYGSIDTAPHATGKYLWGIGLFDKNGNLLAPLGWKYMDLYM